MSDEPVVSAEPDYEAEVRAKWERVWFGDNRLCIDEQDYEIRYYIAVGDCIKLGDFTTPAEAWKSAYAHLKAVEEELRCLDREIELIRTGEGFSPMWLRYPKRIGEWTRDEVTYQRSIKRLRELRATAARGLKEGGR